VNSEGGWKRKAAKAIWKKKSGEGRQINVSCDYVPCPQPSAIVDKPTCQSASINRKDGFKTFMESKNL